MSQENVAAVRAIYAAFAVGDVAAVLGGMSPDIVWNEADDFPYADGNPYCGPQAVAEGVFARCIGEWDGFGVDVAEVLDAGDTVVALGHYVGTFKATGKPQRTQFVHVWRMASGKAVQFQQYANTLHVARVIGQA
jgi:hypothetical protein